MSVLCYHLVGTKFHLDNVSASCEVSVATRYKGGNVSGLMEYLEVQFKLLSS